MIPNQPLKTFPEVSFRKDTERFLQWWRTCASGVSLQNCRNGCLHSIAPNFRGETRSSSCQLIFFPPMCKTRRNERNVRKHIPSTEQRGPGTTLLVGRCGWSEQMEKMCFFLLACDKSSSLATWSIVLGIGVSLIMTRAVFLGTFDFGCGQNFMVRVWGGGGGDLFVLCVWSFCDSKCCLANLQLGHNWMFLTCNYKPQFLRSRRGVSF